ncbi:hypothetical protein BAE44_0019192 [Dichanthelium oligosanthes]|uniref:rRNA biogenesis protein RRP36 n=1 Tax=Dichanthelium oligosanthes TaxID=888268 RepID=A0A1E5V3V7_9POAL|nr:hypothetical protein BAE44_0019192 [Dichanthelium oligosanthes]
MRGPNRRRTGASTSAAIASTSSKRDPEEDSASASEESGDDEEVSSSSGSESESESDGEDAERERELERALADVPFGELQRARADGSLAARAASAAKAAAEKKARRASKKRPMEISTKVRPPKFKEVIQVPKKVSCSANLVVRDPRFEPIYGSVDKEGLVLCGLIWVLTLDNQLKSHPQKNTESEILREHIKKEREAAKAGKRPYYLKKSELRERKLMNKYKELKEAGKLDAFMERRRKKNASKDHRYMPYRRNGDGA